MIDVVELAWLDDFSEIERQDWDALVATSATSTVFQTFAWHEAAWRACDSGEVLKILHATEGGKTVGLAAFALSSESVLRFVGHDYSDFADIVCAPERNDVRKAMFAELGRFPLHWRRIEFKYLPAESPSVTVLSEVFTNILTVNSTPCPVLKIAGHMEHFDAVRRKKSLKRHHNFFRKQDGYFAHTTSDSREISNFLPDFFDQHIRRWEDTDSPSLFCDERSRLFYRSLLDTAKGDTWLRFTRIGIGEKVVAYHFGMSFQGMFVWYKPTFDPEWARKSPGEALLKELLELAAAERCVEFNFTVGDEAFKSRFANHRDENLTIMVYRLRAHYLVSKMLLSVKKSISGTALGRSVISTFKRMARR